MTKFTITRIESGKVYAWEKNPLGERPEKEWFGSPHDPVFESYHKVIMEQKKKWQETEQSLKEYPLRLTTKDFEIGICNCIGVEISGTVVNGEIVIR